MSSLLNEAIIDAKALKEAALKNAEAAVIDKYSEEVKQTLDALLEQEEEPLAAMGAEEAPAEEAPLEEPAADPMGDDLALGGDADDLGGAEEIAPEVPLSATDDILDDGESEGDTVEFNVDLQALQEAIESLSSELNEDEEIEINEESLESMLSEEEDDDAEDDDAEDEEDEDAEDNVNEEVDTDSLIDSIMEKLTVEMGADLAGWAGRSSEDQKYQMEKEMAHRRSTEVEEEMSSLKKAQEELVFENNKLSERINNYEQVVGDLKDTLQEVNLSNARLLYTNRVLRNTSLNERQKTKIVEAISNAGSVTEARTIYDTLESTVQSAPKRGPQSLGEAISNRSSVIRASTKESTSSDPIAERMKRLAGIK